MDKNTPDYSTYEGARELAHRIESYWRSQGGYEVWIEPVHVTHRSVTGQEITTGSWGLCSDLVNGWPSRPPRVPPDRSQGAPHTVRQVTLPTSSKTPKSKRTRRKKDPVVIGLLPRTQAEVEAEILELPLGAYPLGGGGDDDA